MRRETVRAHTRRTSRGRTTVRRHTRRGGFGPQLVRGALRLGKAGRAARHQKAGAAIVLALGGILEIAGWLSFRLIGVVLVTVILLLGMLVSWTGAGTTAVPSAKTRAQGGAKPRLARCGYCKARRTLYPMTLRPGVVVKVCWTCKKQMGSSGRRRPR